jgi:alkylation response protein AidB-like acyl-CoA dehydrogenase
MIDTLRGGASSPDIYDLPQGHKELRAVIRRLVRERVAPRAAEIDAKGEYPWDVRRLFSESDLLALPFDAEYGGTGTGTLMLQVAVEEVARVRLQRSDPDGAGARWAAHPALRV